MTPQEEATFARQWAAMARREGHRPGFPSPFCEQQRSTTEQVQQRRDNVLDMVKTGKSAPKIAAALGVRLSLVHDDVFVLRERGLLPKGHFRPSPEQVSARRDKVLRLTLDGLSSTEVGRAVGVSDSVVRQDRKVLQREGRL